MALLALVPIACRAAEAGDAKEAQVAGRVFAQHGWCSGARPTPEQMEARRKPVPQPGFKLLLRKGKVNGDTNPREVVTDANGDFTIQLPTGDWCVVEEAKRKVALTKKERRAIKKAGGDPMCVERARQACDAIWTVMDAGLGGADITFARPCSWGYDPCYPDRHISPPP